MGGALITHATIEIGKDAGEDAPTAEPDLGVTIWGVSYETASAPPEESLQPLASLGALWQPKRLCLLQRKIRLSQS